MKIIVILLLVAIVASLAIGLFYLSRDDKNSPRVLAALKVRVALSVALVVFLLLSYFMGWME